MSELVMLDPTLAAAVAKIDRSLVYIKTPKADPVLLGNALEILKSASKLIASRRTVLVEMEDELPAPGPALFDDAGAPAPGVAPVTTDDVVLAMTWEAFDKLPWQVQNETEEDLWFAVRSHMRARQFPIEDFRTLKDLFNDDLSGFDKGSFEWLINEVKTNGDFNWPHTCEKCHAPRAVEETLCSPCDRERRNEIWKAEQAAKKAAAKAAKPKAPKKAKNPLTTAPAEAEEGGDE